MGIEDYIRTAGRELGTSHESGQYTGIYVGTVTDNNHPDGEYRVRVAIPSLHDNQNTYWARVSTMMAGKEMGAFWLPELNEEVIVAFANGSDLQPIVLGSLWNGQDVAVQSLKASPDNTELKASNSDQGGKNNYRFWHTRSGHTLLFCDEDGSEFISLRTPATNELLLDDGNEIIKLYDSNNSQWLEIDVAGKKITLQTDEGDIHIEAKETISMQCKNFTLKADETIKIESTNTSDWKAGDKITVKGGADIDVTADANINEKGKKINMNC